MCGAVAEIANRLLGVAFTAEDDDLYPGFSFVQYVCVAAGIPITQPEELIRLTDKAVEGVEDVQAGDVVAIQNAFGDNVSILLTIGAGDGRVIYATSSGGWVVISYMDQMDSSSTYRWDMRMDEGE